MNKTTQPNFQNRNSHTLFPRWHHNNNILTALPKTTFTLPLTSALQVLCFGVFTQMNIQICNILCLQQMLLIVNSTPHATITATLLTPAVLYNRPIRLLNFGHVHTSSCTKQSCIVLDARNLYKENCDRRARFLCKSTCARFLYKFLEYASPV